MITSVDGVNELLNYFESAKSQEKRCNCMFLQTTHICDNTHQTDVIMRCLSLFGGEGRGWWWRDRALLEVERFK